MGPSWDHLGAILASLRNHGGAHGPSWSHLGAILNYLGLGNLGMITWLVFFHFFLLFYSGMVRSLSKIRFWEGRIPYEDIGLFETVFFMNSYDF